MNQGTFSSGRFLVVRFKDKLNATLLGTPTGGATASYGCCKRLCLDDRHFSASIRYWDFSYIFGYKGAIKPDFLIEPDIESLNQGRDGQLKLSFVEKDLKFEKESVKKCFEK